MLISDQSLLAIVQLGHGLDDLRTTLALPNKPIDMPDA